MRSALVLLSLGLSAVSNAVETTSEARDSNELRTPIQPSHEAAEANAFRIFNAIHSAGRQWGSSLNHNGFGFFPAVMPRGTITYHGTRNTTSPPLEPEWLAFEPEHAENFATSLKGYMPGRRRPKPPERSEAVPEHQQPLHHVAPVSQEALSSSPPDGDERWVVAVGYLHTYRANRDLNLLYVDGLGAAKSDLGTMDSQDLLLRENKTNGDNGVWEEWQRAKDICDIVTDWGYDGFVRTEIGFEIVYCDFSTGLDLVSATRTHLWEDRMAQNTSMTTRLFQWARAVSERYDGLGADRLRIDFSSMVSGFFFPINVSHTQPDRPDLIRLGATPLDDLKDIKTYLHAVSDRPREFNVNWQGVVDMIVSRFANRLAFMNSDVDTDSFISDLEASALTYFDAPPFVDEDTVLETDSSGSALNRTADAIDRCVNTYLMPALAMQEDWTAEDDLVHTAVSAVLSYVCNSLFYMRSVLLEASHDTPVHSYRIKRATDNDRMRDAVGLTKNLTRSMVEALDWTVWKKTRPCPVDEVMFVAMWPFGSDEDHWHPGCRSSEDLAVPHNGYWRTSF